MGWSEGDKKLLSATARTGALGKRETLVEQYLTETYRPDKKRRILDFGCGAYANSVKRLRKLGYKISGYDFCPETPVGQESYEKNLDEGFILPEEEIVIRRWELILASNVLNIQPSLGAFYKTIGSIKATAKEDSKIIVNFPRDPRRNFDADRKGDLVFREHMRGLFHSVDEIRFKSGRIWVMTIGER